MSRYINADEFYKDVCDSIDQMTSAGISVDGAYLWAKMQNALENAPSIDIVRCKECKHAHMTYAGYCKYCDMWGEDEGNCVELYLDGDFYCSYGERKESDDEF